tara:strand:+ start:127 stop:420 length:294 start_codon:yes stop_codon:yes gene_type:complete
VNRYTDRPKYYDGGVERLPSDIGKHERAVIEKNKTKLFATMVDELIKYHGSAYRFRLSANISVSVMKSIGEFKLTLKPARKILDAYNKMKKEQRNGK